MFEISWSELLVLAAVTLIFLGPKDMLVFFNTLGRQVGALRRQANEFRRHFEDAMREAEFDRINEEVMKVKDQVTGTVKEAEQAAASIKGAASAPIAGPNKGATTDAPTVAPASGTAAGPVAGAAAHGTDKDGA